MSRSDDGPLTWGKMPSPEVPGTGSGLEITAELLDEFSRGSSESAPGAEEAPVVEVRRRVHERLV